MQVISLFFGLLMMMFAVWAYLPSDPNTRMSRACEPVRFVTSVVGSTVGVVVDREIGDDWKRKASAAQSSCQLVLWEHFFGDDYRAELGYPPGTPLEAIADDMRRGVSPKQPQTEPSK